MLRPIILLSLSLLLVVLHARSVQFITEVRKRRSEAWWTLRYNTWGTCTPARLQYGQQPNLLFVIIYYNQVLLTVFLYQNYGLSVQICIQVPRKSVRLKGCHRLELFTKLSYWQRRSGRNAHTVKNVSERKCRRLQMFILLGHGSHTQ